MKILKTANYKKIAGKTERGKRDGTGPFEGSAQRNISNKGKRKERGEKCLFEKEKGKRDGTGPFEGSAQKSISDKGKRKEEGGKCPFEKKNKKTAQVQVNGILNGKSKQSARNTIYKLVEPYIEGFFSDDSWAPIHFIWKLFENNGISWEIINTKYEKDENGNLLRKIWFFKINFIDNKNKEVELNGMITAAGAGTVQYPLSRYDVTFII